jgi:hypothetical protein
MKRLSLSLFTIIFAGACATQRALPPRVVEINPRRGLTLSADLNVTIFDGRVSPSQSESLKSVLFDQLKEAYPDVKVTKLSDDSYYKDPMPHAVTIKIAIEAYNADFGSKVTAGIGTIGGVLVTGIVPEGTWNGLSALFVSIYDYRNERELKRTATISKLVSKSNMFGYATADTALREAYESTVRDLLFFTDDALIK